MKSAENEGKQLGSFKALNLNICKKLLSPSGDLEVKVVRDIRPAIRPTFRFECSELL